MSDDDVDKDQSESSADKLKIKAFGPAADAFGKEIAPIGERGGKLLNRITQVMFDVVEGLPGRCRLAVHWLAARVEELTKEVPPEKLVDPDPRIIGPIIMDIGLSVDEDEIKEMYAKLASADINADTKNLAHPSFVEIIKQMSVTDTKVLEAMVRHESIFVARMKNLHGPGDITLGQILSFEVKGVSDADALFSIYNLTRLGVVEMNVLHHPVHPDENEERKKAFKKQFEFAEAKDKDGNLFNVRINHVGLFRTPIGIRFRQVCLGKR